MRRIVLMTTALLGLLILSGCGGGGGGGGSVTPSPGPKDAVISFSLSATQALPYQIGGVEIRGAIPAGVTVTTVASSSTHKDVLGLAPGSALGSTSNWQGTVYGTYSAPVLHVIIAPTSSTGFSPGEILRLSCKVDPGVTPDPSVLQAIDVRSYGNDILTTSLDSYLSKSITVTFP